MSAAHEPPPEIESPLEAEGSGPSARGPSPQEVERATVRLLGKQGLFRPTVRLVELGGRKLVAKDYRPCLAPYRWVVGRWNLRRESEALTRLEGIDGVPRVEGRAGRWVLLITHFAGRDLGKTPKDLQTPEFFDRLLAMVQEMHRRGVLHLDLRQRRNLLFRPGGLPAIIDFGASLCVRPDGFLARHLAPVDTSGVLKYKRRAGPDTLTEEEARFLRRMARRRKWWPFG